MSGRFATGFASAEAERAALALLDAVDAGQGVSGALEDLAAVVLAAPEVALALDVKGGGRLRVRRGIELAELVLRLGMET